MLTLALLAALAVPPAVPPPTPKHVARVTAVGYHKPIYVDPAKVAAVYCDEASGRWTIRLAGGSDTIPTRMSLSYLLVELGWEPTPTPGDAPEAIEPCWLPG